MCIVVPTLSFLHLPDTSLCVFDSINTVSTYNTYIETDEEYEEDFCVINQIVNEDFYTDTYGEKVNCRKRGVVLFVELLVDITLPFDRFSYDLNGLRAMTYANYSTRGGFSRLASHIFFHDLSPPYIENEVGWLPGPTLRKFHSFELLFPEADDHIETELNDFDWSFYVGTPTTTGTDSLSDCTTERHACLLLEDAANMVYRDGSIIFILENAQLTDAVYMYNFVTIEGYQRTTIDFLRNVTVSGLGKVWCTTYGALYIEYVRFILDDMEEDCDYPEEAMDAFLMTSSFMYLYHVEIMSTNTLRWKRLHEYTCVLMALSCRIKLNNVVIYNFMGKVPLSSLVWIHISDRPARFTMDSKLQANNIHITIKRLRMFNITSSGPGGALFVFLGENIRMVMSLSEFINCTVRPYLNVEEDGVTPILIDGWIGFRQVENGGGAVVIMVYSLADLSMLNSGTGFIFQNNKIEMDDSIDVVSYGTDIIIYVFDDTTITFPSLPRSLSFSSSFLSPSSSFSSFSSFFHAFLHRRRNRNHGVSRSRHITGTDSSASRGVNEEEEEETDITDTNTDRYRHLAGLQNEQLYKHSSLAGQASVPGDNVIIGFFDGNENQMQYYCDGGSGDSDGDGDSEKENDEEEDNDEVEDEEDSEEGDDGEDGSDSSDEEVVCNEDTDGAVPILHYTRKKYNLEEVLGPIIHAEIACDAITMDGNFEGTLSEREEDFINRCENNRMEVGSCRIVYDSKGEYPLYCFGNDQSNKGWNMVHGRYVAVWGLLFFLLKVTLFFL